MRKLGVILLVVLVVLGGILFYVSRNLEAFLEAQRDWIAARAGEAVGREVRFGAVGVAWRDGLSASLADLSIADDVSFSPEPFLNVGSVYLVVDLWPALRGDYRVTRIVFDRPQVALIRTKGGLNVDSLAGGKSAPGKVPSAEASGAANPLPLLISLLEVRDGQVRYIDRTVVPARDIVIADLDVELADIGWSQPIRVDAGARLLDARQADVRITGTVGPIAAAGDIAAAPLDLRAALAPVAAGELKGHPLLSGVIPPGLSLAGPLRVDAAVTGTAAAPLVALKLDATAAEIGYGDSFSKPRSVALRIDGDLESADDVLHVRRGVVEIGDARLAVSGQVRTAPTMRFELHLAGDAIPLAGWDRLVPAAADLDLRGNISPDLAIRGTGTPQVSGKVALDAVGLRRDALEISGITALLGVDGDRLLLPKTKFRMSDAEVELAATYDRGREVFHITTDVVGMLLAPVLGTYAPQAARWLEGTLDAALTLDGRGTQWESIRSSLTGSGTARLRDGRLRELNLADTLLAGLTGAHGLSALISPEVRAKYPELLAARETVFQDVGGKVRIADGRIVVDELALVAREHRVAGSGWISLAGDVDLTANMALSVALTQDLVARVPQARGLVSEAGSLTVPFRLTGPMPDAKVVPDMDFVLRKVGRTAIESGIDRLFRKPEGAGDQPTPTPRAEEQLLRRGLDAVFGR